jgi:hypothetical protein
MLVNYCDNGIGNEGKQFRQWQPVKTMEALYGDMFSQAFAEELWEERKQ